MVTLKSLGGFLPWRFSPFVNKSPCQLYFPLHINLVGDLFVLPHILHVVEGHLWKAQWKEKPNDEGHRKLTMNSEKRPLDPSGRNNESLAQQCILGP